MKGLATARGHFPDSTSESVQRGRTQLSASISADDVHVSSGPIRAAREASAWPGARAGGRVTGTIQLPARQM